MTDPWHERSLLFIEVPLNKDCLWTTWHKQGSILNEVQWSDCRSMPVQCLYNQSCRTLRVSHVVDLACIITSCDWEAIVTHSKSAELAVTFDLYEVLLEVWEIFQINNLSLSESKSVGSSREAHSWHSKILDGFFELANQTLSLEIEHSEFAWWAMERNDVALVNVAEFETTRANLKLVDS